MDVRFQFFPHKLHLQCIRTDPLLGLKGADIKSILMFTWTLLSLGLTRVLLLLWIKCHVMFPRKNRSQSNSYILKHIFFKEIQSPRISFSRINKIKQNNNSLYFTCNKIYMSFLRILILLPSHGKIDGTPNVCVCFFFFVPPLPPPQHCPSKAQNLRAIVNT